MGDSPINSLILDLALPLPESIFYQYLWLLNWILLCWLIFPSKVPLFPVFQCRKRLFCDLTGLLADMAYQCDSYSSKDGRCKEALIGGISSARRAIFCPRSRPRDFTFRLVELHSVINYVSCILTLSLCVWFQLIFVCALILFCFMYMPVCVHCVDIWIIWIGVNVWWGYWHHKTFQWNCIDTG